MYVQNMYTSNALTYTTAQKSLSCPIPSDSGKPAGAANHKSLHKGPQNLSEKILKTWKTILHCLQSHHTRPFTSDLLCVLSPLLVFSLTCKQQEMVSVTLHFWAATFDKSQETLVYPKKLRDVFVKYRSMWDLQLQLPGFEVCIYTYSRRMQCIVGSLYAVYTAAIFGVVQNYTR